MRFSANRHIFLSIVIMFIPFVVNAQTSISLDEAVQRGAAYLQSRFPKGTRAVAVPGKSENDEIANSANKKLSNVLVNGGWFVMVATDDEAQKNIAGEMKRHLNLEVSEETEHSIGKQLGAQIIISNALNREGQAWRLDIEAVWTESAQRAGQWFAGNIRAEADWASLASSGRAGLSFAGDALQARERQTIIDGLRNGLQTWKTALDLDENAKTGYAFTVTFYKEQLPSAPPANTALLRAEVTVEFSNNGRVLYKTGPYYITEMTDALLARRVAERLGGDQAFFNRVNDAIK
jgi:hypothetical protein